MFVLRVRGRHELAVADRQQVILSHHPRHPLVVHQHPLLAQFRSHPQAPVTTPVREDDFLHSCPHSHVFFPWSTPLQVSVKPRPAGRRQLAHPFHCQTALQRHHFPDLVVDATPPLCWRRASTLCKARSKKSASSTFSAKAVFNVATSPSRTVTRRSAALCSKVRALRSA